MKGFLFFMSFFLSATLLSLQAQSLIDFEEINLETDTFWNGINQEGGITSGEAYFPNFYSTDFGGYWASGWAISNKSDSTTMGFMNLYGSRPGAGAEGSEKYAVGQQKAIISFPGSQNGVMLDSVAIANMTYGFFSMQEGDFFAKKFGGDSGDEPDFFKLTIFKYLKDSLYQDSVEVYLSDFRFEDNTQDFILKDWKTVDLSGLGMADSILFVLSSSDVGDNGINTPLFFALDNLAFSPVILSSNDEKLKEEPRMQIYPNPFSERIFIELENENLSNALLEIMAPSGQVLRRLNITNNRTSMELGFLPAGWYLVRYRNEKTVLTKKIVRM